MKRKVHVVVDLENMGEVNRSIFCYRRKKRI